jgi:hypothetical protein
MERRVMDPTVRSSGLRKGAAALVIFVAVLRGLFIPENVGEGWAFTLASLEGVFGVALLLRPWRYDETGELRTGEHIARIYYIVGAIGLAVIIALDIAVATVGLPIAGQASESTLTRPVFIVDTILQMIATGLLVALALRPPSEEPVSEFDPAERDVSEPDAHE